MAGLLSISPRIALPCLSAALIAAACADLSGDPRRFHRKAEVAGAVHIGAEECGVCHESIQGHEQIASYHSACESCHGPGSLHADSEDPELIRYPGTHDCLQCHGLGHATHMQWDTGDHAQAGLICADCHNPHNRESQHLRTRNTVHSSGFVGNGKRMDAASGLCLSCHSDVGSLLQLPSHHPVGEGALACISCHDPHEDRQLVFGEKSAECLSCHQEHAGPWTFEHPPVVEDCALCHNPHGAVSANLLETPQPAICLSCHSLADLWHHDVAATGVLGNTIITGDNPTAAGEVIGQAQAMAFLRRCSDCHGAVHGSYTDEHLRH